MKLEQEVYGLHNGEGVENFNAEKGDKHKEKHGDKKDKKDGGNED